MLSLTIYYTTLQNNQNNFCLNQCCCNAYIATYCFFVDFFLKYFLKKLKLLYKQLYNTNHRNLTCLNIPFFYSTNFIIIKGASDNAFRIHPLQSPLNAYQCWRKTIYLNIIMQDPGKFHLIAEGTEQTQWFCKFYILLPSNASLNLSSQFKIFIFRFNFNFHLIK